MVDRQAFTLTRFLVLLISVVIIISLEATAEEEEKKNHEDYYTSLTGVQELAKKEQEVVRRLIRYKKTLQSRLDRINAYLNDYNETIQPLIRDPRISSQLSFKHGSKRCPVFKKREDVDVIAEHTSGHPLMVFKLLRRFAKELPDFVLELMDDVDTDFREYLDSIPETMNLPAESDITGATDGLLRLQETYELSAFDMSNGKLLNKETGCKLRAVDMQMIGVQALNTKRYAMAVEWLYAAVQRAIEGDDSLPLELLQEHLRVARESHNQEFLKFSMGPTNLYSNLINSNVSNLHEVYVAPWVNEPKIRLYTDSIYDYTNFHALCRGEKLLSKKRAKNLRCWYSHSSPFNVISPLKFEMHHEEPHPVYQIYDLLSDRVIQQIKDTARPHFRRAQVVGSGKGGEQSDVRTSSVAWLLDKNKTMITSNVPRMAERVSGLNVWPEMAAEDLQISCYGSIGGHYIPHMDALIHPGFSVTDFDAVRGDRVATVMFYLSDVELGGGTAFPRLGVAAKAVKGSAVMWHNLRRNGDRELFMLHGGCPVLYGNKWVANKWIRLYDQVHIRKCSKCRFD